MLASQRNSKSTSFFIGIDGRSDTEQMQIKGAQFCETDYYQNMQKFPDHMKSYLPNYCVTAAYYQVMLNKGYKFNYEKNEITIGNDIDGKDITWTLGAAIDIAMGYSPEIYVRD